MAFYWLPKALVWAVGLAGIVNGFRSPVFSGAFRNSWCNSYNCRSLVMWRVLLREEMLCLFLPPPWIRHLLMLQLPLTKDRRSTQSERLRMCLGLPYICAGNTNAYTGRLVCSGLWKSLCKCTVRANIGGKITLLLFLFSPSLIGKLMSVHGIQRPLLLSHQAVLLGRGNAPKGSRPQEKDEMSFLQKATGSAREVSEADVGFVEGSVLLVLHPFFSFPSRNH